MMGKKRKSVIIAVALSAVTLSAVLILGALYISEKQQKSELSTELSVSEMELYIRKYTNLKTEEMQLSEKKAYDDFLAQEKLAKQQMIEKDEEDLLTLVNPWNAVPENWKTRIIQIGRRGTDENMYLDERAAQSLSNMLNDCKEAGNRPVVISAYRTNEYQQKLYDAKVLSEIANGISPDNATETAAQSVAKPGTSEHELGLAVDIIDDNYQDLDYWQAWTSTQQWLMSNCTNYGFILRYPTDTTDTTGIIYEPWHYRYVGKKLAEEYVNSGAATFEEFIAGR